MPVYVFKCPECGKEVEKFMRMSESNATVLCDHVHQVKMEKQLTSGHFKFTNGAGVYAGTKKQ